MSHLPKGMGKLAIPSKYAKIAAILYFQKNTNAKKKKNVDLNIQSPLVTVYLDTMTGCTRVDPNHAVLHPFLFFFLKACAGRRGVSLIKGKTILLSQRHNNDNKCERRRKKIGGFFFACALKAGKQSEVINAGTSD